jgi:hypothetical protein
VGEGAGAIQNVHQYLAEISGPRAAQPEPQASQAVPAPSYVK